MEKRGNTDLVKIAIIGASYLQNPLILKAKDMGYETHVFAWKSGDIGEKNADYFYPISIIEKENILEKCKEIGVNGICSIASDLAMVTVNYVADKMGLCGNSLECTRKTTNKYQMRKALSKYGVLCPKFILADDLCDYDKLGIDYPIIVKPTDRSGSRAVTRLESNVGITTAITTARDVSFEKKAIIEKYIKGKEYSVEGISYNGEYKLLAITEKFTTGIPNFIEKGHFEPAPLADTEINKIRKTVTEALDALEIKNGASHSEILITDSKEIYIVEIGGRMGGDCIGSSLVKYTTGIDFVKAVIDVALGKKPNLTVGEKYKAAGIKYIFDESDLEYLNRLHKEHPEIIVEEEIEGISDRKVVDSSTRFGYYILAGDDIDLIKKIIEY